ncbi:MAG: hypothetical protein N2235_24200 [Fischerella sp.]|nr:hypothetical protein [Fischerella sp.]
MSVVLGKRGSESAPQKSRRVFGQEFCRVRTFQCRRRAFPDVDTLLGGFKVECPKSFRRVAVFCRTGDNSVTFTGKAWSE